jgi:hypothetical protein
VPRHQIYKSREFHTLKKQEKQDNTSRLKATNPCTALKRTEILVEHSHTVLRLPLDHLKLNSTELRMERNTTFKLRDPTE